MPKATVNEYGQALAVKDEIRSAGHIAVAAPTCDRVGT
jgi:hypothetical protein